MYYFFGLIYIVLCIQRINDAAISPPIIRNTFLNTISLLTTTVYVLIGIVNNYSVIFSVIAFLWLVTSIYLSDHKKVFIFRSLINIALVSIFTIRHFFEVIR